MDRVAQEPASPVNPGWPQAAHSRGLALAAVSNLEAVALFFAWGRGFFGSSPGHILTRCPSHQLY